MFLPSFDTVFFVYGCGNLIIFHHWIFIFIFRVLDGLVNNELVDCFKKDWTALRGHHLTTRDSSGETSSRAGTPALSSRAASCESHLGDVEPEPETPSAAGTSGSGSSSRGAQLSDQQQVAAEHHNSILATTCLHYLALCSNKVVSAISVHPDDPGDKLKKSEKV